MSAGLIGPSSLGSVILLTPFGRSKSLSAANGSNDSAHEPFCYFLEIDQAKILLDCGANLCREALDIDHLQGLQEYFSS